MALEDKIEALIVALEKNTEAHANLAQVAVAASAAKTSGEADKPAEEPKKETTEKTTAKKTTAKKTTAKKTTTKTATPPELPETVSDAELKKAAADYLKTDDETVRDERKENFKAALAHLGASKLGEVDTDEDRARLFGYVAYWQAGLEVDFEAIDEVIAAANEGAGDGEEDDLLG